MNLYFTSEISRADSERRAGQPEVIQKRASRRCGGARLLASVKVRDQVSHPLRRDSGRSSNRNRHPSPSVNTSRHIGTNPVSVSDLAIWHEPRQKFDSITSGWPTILPGMQFDW